jgi:hypothetical protein
MHGCPQLREHAPGVPHETTANQFFTESQFESYRALGFEIAYKMFCYAERRPRLDTAAEAERPAIAIVRHRQEPPGILPPGPSRTSRDAVVIKNMS